MQYTRTDIRKFAREAREIGVQYIGLCCGSASNLLRELAFAYGRNPPAMKFEPDLNKSFVVGDLYGRSAHILQAMTGRDAASSRKDILSSQSGK
jgi:hypothetical protein